MRSFAILVSPLATLALVLAFGWPVLLACVALALGTLLLSTSGAEAGELQAAGLVDAPNAVAADL
ncbi:hypothetical protein J7E62_31585 [Variovorax paradoxus]|nr:hypothetical protein [Variovorax paradoxus]